MFRVGGGKTKNKLVAFLLALSLFVSSSEVKAAAGINKQINFQGKVVNTNGTNVTNGNYDFVFKLYSVSSGGTALWTETWNSGTSQVTVTDGVFQVNLGTHTSLPGSVDFNTDNIYLGVEFNADGEMTPRVRFTAAPYAMNADKVHGLTVTDTTGTLTIPNGETLSFGGSFTTSASNDVTLTTSGATNVTLPTTGTLATLLGTETLNNKTIGSAGLVFSGATTDITTASGESLVLTAAGAGTVDIQDATTVDSLTADTGGVSIASGQSYTGAGAVTLSSGGSSGLTLDAASGVVAVATGDYLSLSHSGVSGAAAGYIWYDSSDNKFKINENGTTKTICNTTDLSCGGGSTTWDTIGDPTTTGSVAMADWGQTLDWNTNNVTAIAMDGLSVTITNDAATDVLTQRAFVVANQDDSASTGTTETIAQVVNRDINETVTNGLLIENTGAGTMTNGLQIAETAGTITDGILITGTLGNILNSGSIDITGAGAITGATGVTSTTITASSTIDAQGDLSDSTGNLTLNDAVDISGALAVSGTSLTATSATTITLGSTGADTIILGNGGVDTITIGAAAATGVSIVDNNWSVTTAGVASFITGSVIGSQTFTTNNIADSGALTIASGSGAALTLNSGTTGTINLGTDASAETINIGNTGAAVKVIAIGNNSQANTITIGDASATTVSITDNNWSIGTGGAASFTSITSSGAIAANGGITFDAATDTVGAFTAAGTIDMNANILTNIGNSGTDFVASTGALTLAGVLTANGGISLSASQSLSAAALSYMDLGSITYGTTANQGLRLPNAASATPSNPTSGEGYLAWDSAGNQLITYNGSAWVTIGGGSGYNLIKDETTSLAARTTLAFLGAGVSCADNAGQTECTISGGSGSDLQGTYDTDTNGSNVTISLTSADDSVVISNPASSGTDSSFTFKVEQLNTGIANDALYVDNRGTGNGLRIDDESGDTTPFIIDGDGRVGIGTSSISSNAATERLLQVGSETNRGNAAVYGEVISKGQRDITALTNIKDIFVYDTTADSDGGRWIDWATTDKLSWYTETLDDGPNDPCNIATDDRCYKASFPRKATLVVTSDALYIFDTQDNTLWMKFSQNASGYALGADTNNDPSSVTALNGVIYVGTNGTSAGGLYAFDFTSDRMWNYDTTDRSGADVGIGNRNSAVTYNSDNNTSFDLGTVGTVADWGRINDVSAAVIRFSTTAIAATTGPNNGATMIALATDSGLTTINLTTQKVFQYSDATDNDYNAVVVTRTAKLYGLNEALGQAEMWINIDSGENLATRVNGTPDKLWDEASTPPLSKSAPTIIAGAPDALEVVERGSLADGGILATATVASSSDLLYVGTNRGLTEIHVHQTVASSWSKFYNTTRQTSLMPATIRRYHPMDDVSGNVTNQSNKTSIFTAKGTPTYGINGVRGKAMTFNGTNQYLCSDANADGTCDNDTTDNMSTGSWTISVWFKHSTTIAGTDVLFARCHNTTPAAAAGCVAASMTSTGSMAVNVDFDATFTIGATGTTVFHNSTQLFNDNQWHFLVITRAATTGNINTMIDGKPIGQTAGVNTTLDASQILSIGADCSVGAACSTGANFWDGSVDEFVMSTNGGTGTDNNITTTAMRRLYNDARPLLNKKVIGVTDATTATSTTIGDSGETWIPNEFAGQVMEITGGTGAGQTRRVVSNTATVLTVSPAFSTTPDTTSDFGIDPEALYGASDSVTAIGITGESAMGEARQMCVGTNSGTDTGGVTCFNHQAGPNIVAEVYHGDSGVMDDSATEWTGTDYDDIQSIDVSGRSTVIGTMAHTWTETQDTRLGQGMDYLANKVFDLTNAVKNLGMQTLAGSSSMEIGLTGGADLAERYYSNESLQAGEVVSIDQSLEAGVRKTSSAYQRDVLGIVATQPAIVMGPQAENEYPIALAGRVPVKVTNENGQIYVGDRLTSASRPGHAMRATQSGRVIGEVLSDASDWAVCDSEDPDDPQALLCTTVLVFVNLTDYTGQSIDVMLAEHEKVDGLSAASTGTTEQGLTSETQVVTLAATAPSKQERVLSLLKELRTKQAASVQSGSGIFTGQVTASESVVAPEFVADDLTVKRIKAGSLEGLVIDGKLLVKDDAEFGGNTVFGKLASFIGQVIFKSKVSFESMVTFNRDTAGFAVIAEGQKSVTITFDEQYGEQPIVSVMLTSDANALTEEAEKDEALKSDVRMLTEDFQNAYFDGNVKYLVTDKSTKGFTIVLNKKAPRELSFSWVALSVKNAKTFRSVEVKEQVETATETVSEEVKPVETVSEATESLAVPETVPVEDMVTPVSDAGNTDPVVPIAPPVEETTPLVSPTSDTPGL